MKKLGLSLLAVSLLSTGLFAKADKVLVEEYMNLSGAKITIESMGEQISTNMQQTGQMYGKSVDQKKMRFIKEAFNGEEGIDIVESYLKEHFDNTTLKSIIAYYKSPLGKKVTQASLDVMSPTAQADMLRFMADLSTNPPSAKRVATIKSFIAQLDLSATAEDVLVEMMHFLNEQFPAQNKISNAQMDQLLAMAKGAINQQLFISSLYTYRDMENSELQKVIEFYQTDEGKEELTVVREALEEMLKSGFKRALSQ